MYIKAKWNKLLGKHLKQHKQIILDILIYSYTLKFSKTNFNIHSVVFSEDVFPIQS